MSSKRRLRLVLSIAILLTAGLLGVSTALSGIQRAQASFAAGVPVLGLDCASGTFETPSDGVHDTACTWSGNVDADVDGINDPLISDPAPPSGGGVWVSVLANDLPGDVNGVGLVNGYDITLTYDRRYVDAFATDRSGTDFVDGGPNSPFVLVDSIDHTTGTIRVAVVLLAGRSGPGPDVFFRVKFDIVGVGISPIVFSNHVITTPGSLAHKVIDGSITSTAIYDAGALGWDVSWDFAPTPPNPRDPLTFTAAVTCPGCTGPFSYAWDTDSVPAAAPGTPEATGNPATLPAPPQPVVHRVELTVTDDGSGATTTAVRRLPLKVEVTGPSTVQVNTPNDWSASWLGGIPPYGASWRFCPGVGSTANNVCTLPAPSTATTTGQTEPTRTVTYRFGGTYADSLRVTTSASGGAAASFFDVFFDVTVQGSPLAYTVTVTADRAKGTTGEVVAFTASMVYAGDSAVIIDLNSNGVFDSGETVLAGAAPAVGTPLVDDPKVKFREPSAGNGMRDGTECLFYDANDSNTFDAGETIAGTCPGLAANVTKDDSRVKFVDTNGNGVYDHSTNYPFAFRSPTFDVMFDFGDGTSAAVSGTSTVSTTHTYNSQGAFTVGASAQETGVTTVSKVRESGEMSLQVNPPGEPLAATLALDTANPTAGKPSLFTATATGGTGPYTFTLAFGDGASDTRSGDSPQTFSHSYSVKDSYTATLTVTDSAATPATITAQVTAPVQAQPLVVTVVCPDSGLTVGKPFNCDVSATGGTSPYEGTGSQQTMFAVKGTYTVSFSVTDANGVSATGSDSVTVASQPLVVTVACPDAGLTADKPFNCDVSATGGTSPYQGIGSQSAVLAVKGTYAVSFTVTDANGDSATGSDSVTIDPQPLAVTVVCPDAGLTAVEPFTCDVSAIGGTSPYTGTGPHLILFDVKGTYTVSFTITDANGASAAGSDTVVIDPQPLVATVVCPDAGLTSGKSFSCDVSATGGTSPYSGTGSQEVVFPTKGTYAVSFTVTDANGITATGSDTVIIDPQPLVASFFFSPLAPLTGETVTFTASVSGGTGPYVFSWNFGDGSPAGSGNPATHVYNSQGSFTAILTVTDANGASTTDQRTVSVGGALAADFTFTTPATAGKPVTFTAQPSGGAPPYTFLWDFGDSSPTESGSPVSHTYAVKGSYSVTLTVTDETAQSAATTKHVAVDSQPLVVDFTFPGPVTAGKPVTFTSQVSGGTGPYTVHWDVGADGSFDSTGDTFTTSFPVKGMVSLRLHVIDSNGADAEVTKNVAVDPQPLIVIVNCPDTGLTVGKPFDCEVSATGGTTPYIGTGTFSRSFDAPGTYTVTFTATDANDASADGSDTVQIAPQPPGELVVTVNCPGSGLTGKPFQCDVSAIGGTPPYTGTGAQTTIFSVKGSYTVSFTVTDSLGNSASGSDTITIDAQPLTVTVSCPDTGPTAGKPFLCIVSATGGTPPYVGTGDLTVTIPVKGPATVSFDVTDANLVTSTGSVTVVIDSQPLAVTVECPFGLTVGKPFSCNVSATGGTAPYAGTGFRGVILPVKGTQTVSFDVTDSNLVTAAGSTTVTIDPQPLTVDFTFSPASPPATTPVVFTASASGGTAPYTFSWDFGDGTTGAGEQLSHTYSSPGAYTVLLTVTDLNGQTASMTHSADVGAEPGLTVTIKTSPGTSGKPSSFTANIVGGTGPYTVSWDFGDASSGSGQETSHTYAVKGSYVVTVQVTDSGTLSGSATTTVTVDPQPIVITASCAAATAGKPVDCVAAASGGTAPYTFQWDIGKDGSIDGTGQSFTTTFPVKGENSIDAIVTDGNEATTRINISVAVSPQPLSASFVFSPAPPTSGKPVTFTATASGGTLPYSFSWAFGDDSTGDDSEATHTFSVKGSYLVTLTVTDLNGDTATATQQVSVDPQPLAVDFSFDPSLPATGEPVTFTATASGGTAPYLFSWSFGDKTGDTGNPAIHAYSSAGTFTVSVTVTDANLASATMSHDITVSEISQPLTGDFVFGLATSGKPVSFTATASGGVPPYSFSWEFGDGGSAIGDFVTHSYSAKGSYTVTMRVDDSGEESVQVVHSVTVEPQPLIMSAQCLDGTAGKPVSCNVLNVSGGTSPYSFGWDLGGDETIDGTGDSFSTAFPVKGTYLVVVTATDANDQSASLNFELLIDPQPFVLAASIPATATAGNAGSFEASATGGTAPYTFVWDFGDGTIGSGGAMSHSYSVKGSYLVSVTVSDANSAVAQAQQLIVIMPQVLEVDFTASPSPATVSDLVSFTATVTGGTGPYVFSWDFGDGNTDSGNPAVHTYSSSGDVTVQLTVTDANGAIAVAGHALSILPQPVAPVLLTFDGCDVDAFENGIGELSVFINGDFVVNIPAGLHGLTGSGKYAPYDGVCVSFGSFDITSSVNQGINTLVFQNPLSSHFSQIKNTRVVQDEMVLLFDPRTRTISPGPPKILTFSVPPLVLNSFQTASAAFVTEPVTFMATFTGGTAPFKCTFSFGDGSSKSVTTSQHSCSATHTYWSARLRTATVRVRGVALADDVRGSLLVRVEPQPGCASEDDDNGDEDECLSWKRVISDGEQQTFTAQLTNPASVPVLIRLDFTITRPDGSKETFISPSFALNPGQTLKGLNLDYAPSGGLGTYCFKAPLKYGTDTNNNGVLEDGEILGKRSAISGCFQAVNAASLAISPFLFFGTALLPKARSKISRYFEKKNRLAA